MTVRKIVWFRSLGFKGTLVLVAVAIGLLMGTIWVVNTRGKAMVLEESSKLLEEQGNHMVEELNVRTLEIAALARTIATTSEQLHKDESLYQNFFPPIFDFDGDQKIAGGGIWPEPYQFKTDVDRRSFFWGREKDGTFKYYDDYNDPAGNGYHNEEWYVVVRYTGPGRGFWSKSYMDPYSFQPMVTFTVGTYRGDNLTGTVTVDLKLEGMEEFLKEWQKKSGGYAVLFDRNGKFVAFPGAGAQARIITTDSQGKKSGEFMTASQFSKRLRLFQPITDEVEEMNRYILVKAKNMKGYDPGLAKKIDQDSYQIDEEEAKFISAVIADPLKEETQQSYLFKKFEIENDFLLREKSIVFLFHVPESYWKLAIVKPFSEAAFVATNLVDTLIFNIGALIFLLTGMGYCSLRWFLVKPLSKTAKAVQTTDALIKSGRIQELKDYKIDISSGNEIGILSDAFNTMSHAFAQAHETINEQNRTLEQKVEERTRKLSEEVDERKKAEEKVKKAKEEVETVERFKAGLNDLSIIMQGIQDTKIFSEKVLYYMVNYLKLPLGAFFTLNGGNKLIRSADFGYPKKENLPDLIELGSGLVGQAAVEGKPITLRDIPDYAKASFGFGEVSPEEILLFPLLFNNQTIGVLELGSFKAFTATQLNWIEEAGRSISVVLCVILDNIDRKRHVEMLKKSEERLELVLEGGDLGFWDVNLRNMKTVVNKRWAEQLGYTLEEVEEASSLWEKNIHPDDRERVLQYGKDYREGRISNYEVEYRMYTKEGEIKWILSKGAIVESDEQGVPTRMVGTVMDVTDRRRWKTVDSEAVRKEEI